MYSYINDYNKNCDFFSDEGLLYKIATNINLEDLKNNPDSLEEYYKCKFLQKLDENKIQIFVNGILNNIKSFDELYFFFKIIYPLTPKNQDFSSKDNNITILIICKFFSILHNSNNKIKLIEEYQEVIQTLTILSVMHIKDESEHNYKDFILKLGNENSFDRDDLIEFFIKKIINYHDEKYIPFDKKTSLEQYILKEFYFKLIPEKQILSRKD